MATKITSTNITTTGVTAGTYTNSTITVNSQGQIVSAASGTGGEDLCDETVKQKYKTANYSSIDFNQTGYCALLEGKIFPHWRDQLSCKKSHRIVYVYYHWSI